MTMTMSGIDIQIYEGSEPRDAERNHAATGARTGSGNLQRGQQAVTLLSSADVKEQWAGSFDNLQAFSKLQGNWDSEGAASPSHAILYTAYSYLNALRSSNGIPPAHMAALPSGGILMEWEALDERIEIEISEGNKLEIMRSRAGHPSIHEDKSWDYSRPFDQ